MNSQRRFSVLYVLVMAYSAAGCVRTTDLCASASVGPWDCLQGVEGVPNIEQGLNPATWMLEVTTPGMEDKLGVSFAEYYSQSELAK